MTIPEDAPKYVVLKRDDFEVFLEHMVLNWGEDVAADLALKMGMMVLLDAEVIRHQDITSAPIFYLYSQQLHHFIEMAQAIGMPLANEQELLRIAEHFGDAAHRAEVSPKKKLPD